MLHTSSNRGTPICNDITKIVRQHYKPPSPEPYKHEFVQCRNEVSCKQNKPEDYWTNNYRRRQNNFDCGFYTTPWEPYRPFGGDLILDPYELVTSSLPGHIDKKYHPKIKRRNTMYQLTERLLSVSSAGKKEFLHLVYSSKRQLLRLSRSGLQDHLSTVPKAQEKDEASIISEDLIDSCPTAGLVNIKRFLKESNDRIIAVRSGMPYEEHVRLTEDRLRREEKFKHRYDPDDMVIQTPSLILPFIQSPSPKFESIAEEDEDRVSSPRSFLTGSTRTSASSDRRMSRSPLERWQAASASVSARGRRRSSIRSPPRKLSVVKVTSSLETSCSLLKKERLCRDHVEFLRAIYNILNALHNMKVRDLRSRTPLPKDVVEKLKKEVKEGDGGERSSRGTQMTRGTTRKSRKMSHLDFDLLYTERAASGSNSFVKPHNVPTKSVQPHKPPIPVINTPLSGNYIPEEGGHGRDQELGKKWVSRWSRKILSTDTVDTPDADMDRPGRLSVFNTVKRISVIDNAGKTFSRRRSKIVELQPRGTLETWEDFLNVQPQESRESRDDQRQSFTMQVGILTKFMRWYRYGKQDESSVDKGSSSARKGSRGGTLPYRKASVTPSHIQTGALPTIDKDQLRYLEELKERGLVEKDKERESTHLGGSAPQERVRRLPIWQQVAQEKSKVFHKKSATPNPYTVIQRYHQDNNKMKRSLQKENTAALEKLAREKVATFRLKYGVLNQEECSPLFREQKIKLQHAKDYVNRSHLENFDVQPSKWYEELREKTMTEPYCDDQDSCDMIIKLQHYSHMDNKTVSYAKAKLCLLMMSLPAYDICKIQTQKALKFIFEQVLLGSEAQFDEWLCHRKIPYVVLDQQQTENRYSLLSPVPFTFKSAEQTPSPAGRKKVGSSARSNVSYKT